VAKAKCLAGSIVPGRIEVSSNWCRRLYRKTENFQKRMLVEGMNGCRGNINITPALDNQ
jgi:hypothetical protein